MEELIAVARERGVKLVMDEPEPEAAAGLTRAEAAEVARRRRVLGIGPNQVLSDEQVLQIQDPGPEKKQKKKKKKAAQDTEVAGDAMPLVLAVTAGDVAEVERLIKAGAGAHVNQRFTDGSSLLMHALDDAGGVGAKILCGCLRHLLEANADVNYVDSNGNTALHRAFDAQLPEVADLFLAYGAVPGRCRGPRGACQKCKLYSRRRKQQSKVAKPKQAADTFEQVLQEEFGDGDFMAELARVKLEVAEASGAHGS
eukprot:SAG11_NODE_2717_length_3050_cov_2.389360_2_plen_255_part_00